MINSDKVFQVASNVLKGFLDSVALIFFLSVFSNSLFGVPGISSLLFLKFGFAIGSVYTIKRFFDVLPSVSESVVYNIRKARFLTRFFWNTSREESVLIAVLSLFPVSLAYDLVEELKRVSRSFSNRQTDLEILLEKEGASLDDVPGSFYPKELEDYVSEMKQMSLLREMTRVKLDSGDKF